MFRALPSLACLFSVTVTPSWALAQSNVAAVPLEANDSGYVSLDQEAFSGGVTWNGTYFDVRNQSGSGMGYTHGFTQFGAFRPFWMGDDAFIALNGRLNVIGNGDWGFNTGVVARRLANDANRFYGVNAYYDRDRTYRGNEYTQFGFGFETLGESWDFRANGYIPTGTDTNNLGVVGLSNTPYFFGNRIGFLGYERFEQALSGGDFEFGIPLLPDTSWLRGYAGMYAYQQDLGEDPVGFRGRIEGWVSDDLSVGVQVTHDKQFNTYVNAMVDWRFAGFKPTRYFPNLSTRERMLMPVQRQWRITVGEYVDTADVLAINPRDDVPYFVVWVDNSNTGPGDGTYENPYTTLPGNTLPNETDMLLVRRGDTTQANPLSGNVVLPDYARMLGEGKAHVFDAYANFGSFTATLDNAVLPDPAFTNSGAYPFLTSNVGPIVTLGDHNEVSAFVMRGANGAAIRGFGSNGFHLNNLEIAGNLGGGIVINNATASGNITADGQVIDGALITNINRNTVVGYTPIIPGAGNNGVGGIVIDSGAGGLELTISQVSMNATPGAQAFGVRLFADSGDIELQMDDVHTSGGNTVAGVSLESAGHVFLADVVDLESSNNLGSGIDVLGDGAGSEMTVNLFDPVASGNDTYGLQVIATNGAQIGDPLTAGLDGVNVIDGDFSGSGVDAINVFANGGSHIDLFVDPTLANNAGRHGLRFEVSGGSTLTGRFEQTTFDNAGSAPLITELDGPGGLGRGIFGLVNGTNSLANLLFLDSTANNAADDGMYLSASGNGRANVAVTNATTSPTFDNSGQVAVGASAVEVFSQLGGDVYLTLNNATGNFTNPLTNNDSGLTVNSTDGGSIANVQVVNGGFNNAGQNAVSVGAINNGLAQVFLENTNGNNAGADAVRAASANGRIDLSLDTGEFDNAGQLGVVGAGLRGSATSGGTFNVCVMDSQFNGALDQGIELLANNNGLIRAHVENGSADGNGLEGLHILSDTNGTVDFRAVDFTFNGNGLVAPSDGVYVRADNATAHVGFFSSAPPIITTSANDNTGNGFNFEAVNGAELTARLDTVSSTGNAGYGVRMDATGAGTDAFLLMEGINNISGNTAGNYFFNYNGVDNAIVALTGSFNNNPAGDGLHIDIANVGNAIVTVTGDGATDTIDGNADDGVDIRISNAQQAGVSISGYTSISNNGNDGVYVELTDITAAASVELVGPTDMFDNGDDGVDIALTNVVLGQVDATLLPATVTLIDINSNVAGILNNCLPLPVDVTLNSIVTVPTADGILVDGMTIEQTAAPGVGQDGIVVTGSNVTGTGGITLSNNTITNVEDGIDISLTGNSSPGFVDVLDNVVNSTVANGIAFAADSGSSILTITGNEVNAAGDSAIVADLTGTASYNLTIDNNDILGMGAAGGTTIGLNFLGSTIFDSGFIPPDTMGGVGNNHIVEMLNGVFAIYDKTTGNLVSRVDLDTFFDNVQGITRLGGTFDPRIIFDPVSQRWFATAIDGGGGNSIYLAVSATDDPTGLWRGVQFVGDSVDGVRFNDYVTFSLDADGVYMATNNFGGPGGFDVSLYSIPKADLLGAVPTLTNLTRFEGLNEAQFGDSLQVGLSFEPSDGVAKVLGTAAGTATFLGRADITGSGGAGATISAPGSVIVPQYVPGPDGRQPGGVTPVENVSPRFTGNVVEVGGSLWAVHSVSGTGGNAAVRWYEIDVATNAVIQTGLIEDVALDFLDPSIAVNPNGDVVIGYTGGGPGQFLSSMASIGNTSGGTTTFNTPQVLAAGSGTYDVDFGSGRNRWGDYSATVLDPTDPTTFWTFQEVAAGTDTWGVQVTQISINAALPGTTVNDGIRVTLNDTAALTGTSSISGNTVDGVGRDGIAFTMNDATTADVVTISSNTVTDSGRDGIRAELNGTASVNSLILDNNTSDSNGDEGIQVVATAGTTIEDLLRIGGIGSATGNGITNTASGIDVSLDGVLGTPNVGIAGHVTDDNSGLGISLVADNTDLGTVVLFNNSADSNQLAQGILVDIRNGAMDQLLLVGNDSSNHANGSGVVGDGTGVDVFLDTITGLQTVVINDGIISDNNGYGVRFVANNAPMVDFTADGNIITNSNAGDGFLFQLTNSDVTGTATFSNMGIASSSENGLNLDLTNSSIATTDILNNNVGGAGALVGLDFQIPDATNAAPLQITNTSQAGIDITNFRLDLGPTILITPPGSIWDTIEPGSSSPFVPFGSSDVTTGLNTINGNAVVPPITQVGFTTDTMDSIGTILAGGGVPDDQPILDLGFNDFNSGETFIWTVDSDFIGQPASVPSGADLIGSDIVVNFTGGLFIAGTMQAIVGNPNGSQFVATAGNAGAGGISLNGADGIRISQAAGSDIGVLNITGNVVQQNGLHGLEFLVDNSNLGTTTITDNVISGHENGDGVRLVQPDDTDSQLDLTFARNTIDGNTGGRGVNIELPHPNRLNTVLNVSFENDSITNNGQEGIRLDLTGAANGLANNVTANVTINSDAVINDNTMLDHSDISGNGSFGLSLIADQTTNYNLTVGGTGGQNAFNGNGNAGLAVQATDNTVGQITLANMTANSNVVGGNGNFAGEGVSIRLAMNAVVDPLTVGDATLRNTTFDGNDGDGFSLNLIENSSVPALLIQNVDATNSVNGDGIGIVRRDNSTLSVNNGGTPSIGDDPSDTFAQLVDVNASGNAGAGFNLFATNAQLPITRVDVLGGTFNENNVGLNYLVEADAVVVAKVQNATISENENDGVRITTNQRATFGNVLNSAGSTTATPLIDRSVFSSNTISNNGDAGFEIVGNDQSLIAMTIDGAAADGRTIMDGNRGDGIRLRSNQSSGLLTNSDVSLNITQTNIVNTQGFNGVTTGDGINIVGGVASRTTVNINDTTIGATVPTDILPGLSGDGIDANVTGGGILNLNLGVGGPANDVRIYNNGGAGIRITNEGPNNSQTDNRQDLNVVINNTSSRFNDQRGLDIQLEGNVGGRGVQGDNDSPIDITITNGNFSNNGEEGIFFQTNTGVIQNSLVNIINTGALNTANPPAVSNDYLPPYDPNFNTNSGSPGGGRNGGGFTNGFQTTTRSGTFNNAGRYDGTNYEWNNMYADMVVNFTATGNTIRDNGVNGVGAPDHGMVMRISTNSYVLADVQNNAFSGNGLDDFRTESFITTNAVGTPLQPNNSTTVGGVNTFDSVFLDDTAQMDLRFLGNTGDQINVTSKGAFYTNNDPGKQNTPSNNSNGLGTGTRDFPTFSATNRPADIFVLDNFGVVEGSNTFIQNAIPQSEVFGVQGFFGLGGSNGYSLRTVPNFGDPNFPPPVGGTYITNP